MCEFPYISFGLGNTVQVFQRFIDIILCDLDWYYEYIDDILRFPEEYWVPSNIIRMIIAIMRSWSIWPSACLTNSRWSSLAIWLPKKALGRCLRACREYEMPRMVKDLWRYLDMMNFYRRFLREPSGWSLLMIFYTPKPEDVIDTDMNTIDSASVRSIKRIWLKLSFRLHPRFNTV